MQGPAVWLMILSRMVWVLREVADQPKGQSYYECYDRATGKPSAQWEEIDARVRTDLRRFGLSL